MLRHRCQRWASTKRREGDYTPPLGWKKKLKHEHGSRPPTAHSAALLGRHAAVHGCRRRREVGLGAEVEHQLINTPRRSTSQPIGSTSSADGSRKATIDTTFLVTFLVKVKSRASKSWPGARRPLAYVGYMLGCPTNEMTTRLSYVLLRTLAANKAKSVRCNTMSSLRILPRFAILGRTPCVSARAWLTTTRGEVPRPSGALSTPRTDGPQP